VGLSRLVFRNVRRSPLRTGMTVMTVAVMLAAFIFPRSLVEAQEEQIRQTPNDRVVTRSIMGWGRNIPFGYSEAIRQVPGVEMSCGARWAGFRAPGKPDVFFQSFGVEAAPCVTMHSEMDLPAEQKRAFLEDDHGALLSKALAQALGVSVGARAVFESEMFQGTREVNVSGIFESTREGWGERTLWLHYEHLNRGLPQNEQDKLGMIAAQIVEPNHGARLAAEIDDRFADSQFETLTLEDQVLTASNIGRFRAVLDALDLVSYLILAVVMSMVSNTIAMNVRERTREYGVMRAMGFAPAHIVGLVLGEAVLIGLAGGLIGLGISYPLFEGVVSRALQEAMQFPPIVVPPRVAAAALALGAGLSIVAAGVPAYRVSRLGVTQSLRRIA
jgi:putative ABC transport system permease protein